MKPIAIFRLIIFSLIASVQLEAKFKLDDLTIRIANKVNLLAPGCIIVFEGKKVGTIEMHRTERAWNTFELNTEFEHDLRGSGLSPGIQKRCIESFRKALGAHGEKTTFFSRVGFSNYPSLKMNLGAGMTLNGIDCDGTFLFADKLGTEIADHFDNYKKIVSKKCALEIFEEIDEVYKSENDHFGRVTSKKYLAEKKGIKNARDYFDAIVKLAKENGVMFEKIFKD